MTSLGLMKKTRTMILCGPCAWTANPVAILVPTMTTTMTMATTRRRRRTMMKMISVTKDEGEKADGGDDDDDDRDTDEDHAQSPLSNSDMYRTCLRINCEDDMRL